MSDFSSWILPAVKGEPAGEVPSGNRNLDGAGGMDHIRVVRIGEEHSPVGGKVRGATECYEVEEVIGEEDEDGVYVIEYSNPEEEGASYQFTMTVDRSLPAKRPKLKHPVMRENVRAPLPVMSKLYKPPRPKLEKKQKRKRKLIAAGKVRREAAVLELDQDYSDVMAMSSGRGELICTLCPPGKIFRRAAGLAVHLKRMHFPETNKRYFCTTCKQSVRTQIELDVHTKRHANKGALFTCHLCSADTGYQGSKMGLKKHLKKEHPGIIPHCNICNKGFTSLASYLADQFRHVGVSPYYCAQCQIYEMTERGLSVHNKNHDKRKKQQEELLESGGNQPPTLGVAADNADNSATGNSAF